MSTTPKPVSAKTAERRGFTVDRHCYPWFAYKGPRFAPTETVLIRTEPWPS